MSTSTAPPLGADGQGSSPFSAPRVGSAMALGSMVCIQFGAAASTQLFARIGPGGTTALRLGWAGVVLFVLVRPRLRSFSAAAWRGCIVLGVVTGVMTLLYSASIARLQLGTSSALQFLGPLTLAVVRSRGAARIWPGVAAAGVALLTSPWQGGHDLAGIGFALGAGVGWAFYIVLTQRVGDDVAGLQGLAVSMSVAGILTCAVAGPSLVGHLDPAILLAGLGLALLVPVVPFSLEFLALRRLTAASFGTLMYLEPAVGLLVGLVVLSQVPGRAAAAGIVLVVAAGIGAQRSGARSTSDVELPAAQLITDELMQWRADAVREPCPDGAA